MLTNEAIKILKKELRFSTSRSGGKGGQNVNKLETKVEISWLMNESMALSEDEKIILAHKLYSKLDNEGKLRLHCEKFRTQLENKKGVIEKFINIINKALSIQKKRIKTNPSTSVKKKRMQSKMRRSEMKRLRRKSDFDES